MAVRLHSIVDLLFFSLELVPPEPFVLCWLLSILDELLVVHELLLVCFYYVYELSMMMMRQHLQLEH